MSLGKTLRADKSIKPQRVVFVLGKTFKKPSRDVTGTPIIPFGGYLEVKTSANEGSSSL
jgi:hypothetical protein